MDIFEADWPSGVEPRLSATSDECVLCNLCVRGAAPEGTVHVIKLYER